MSGCCSKSQEETPLFAASAAGTATVQASAHSCCGSKEAAAVSETPQTSAPSPSPCCKADSTSLLEPNTDPSAYIQQAEDGLSQLSLIVDGIHCPSCIRQIEGTLNKLPGIITARVNLSTKRLFLHWDEAQTSASTIVRALDALDFPPTPFNPKLLSQAADKEDKALLRAMGVAGFAAANVMLLSVSVWSGTDQMGSATRDMMHWISALIALPAVAYAGQPFFRSAIAALKGRSLNMDVPISLAVLLALGMSVAETLQSARHAYFDASVMLLFFLLIGRYLDRRMRSRAQSAAQNLLSLRAMAATVIEADGSRRSLPVESVQPGMKVAVTTGEKVPVDGQVIAGRSELDSSLVTGETLPQPIKPGDRVFAGTLNLSAPIEVEVTARDDQTLLAEIVKLMETAEQGRAKYVRLADRAAKIYAPAVHLLSALTFVGWLVISGGDWHTALMNAIAVLIITCPCALGLAVPTVQVVASGLLLKRGILVKAADGLERLAEADAVVFDKTGTLTEGKPVLDNRDKLDAADLRLAASLAHSSKHPLARALIAAIQEAEGPVTALSDVKETPGQGLEAIADGRRVRIGNRRWCGVNADQGPDEAVSELWLSVEGREPVRFTFRDRLRSDAVKAVSLAQQSLGSAELLSGDRSAPVADIARQLTLRQWQAEASPAQKIERLETLKAQGRKVLMVGDGLNDAPALAAAFVSASPASAADVSQTAADFVFQGSRLRPMIDAISIARKARSLIFQNFGLAVLYNCIAVPLAMAGLVTPLIAAIAMSASSLIVTLNALRLRLADKTPEKGA